MNASANMRLYAIQLRPSSILNMTKFISLLFLSALSSTALISQTNSQLQKECRIAGGIGLAGATKNAQSTGKYVWLQLDYKFYKNISIATEFDNMAYKLKSIYAALPEDVNKVNAVEDNFSLILKYHLPTNSPLTLAVASGWTYTIRTSEYYIYKSDSTSYGWTRNVSSCDDYKIPLLLEIEFHLWKTINLHARVRYNLNPKNGSTYSSGVGLSLKL